MQRSLGKIIGTDNILTVHASQGREWETVILSVVDSSDRDIFFTNSEITQGLHTINTAISRVKKNLVIVCDTDYWKRKGSSQLIGAIITDPYTQNAELPFLETINISWSENMKQFYLAGIKEGKLETAINEQYDLFDRFDTIKIDKTTAPYAQVSIKSNPKAYITTLSSCTCKDFSINLNKKVPCKHIFALALKLKLVNTNHTLNPTLSIPSTGVDIIQ